MARGNQTQAEFMRKTLLKHGDRYDYSKLVYVSGASPVTIICKVHGEFSMRANSHTAGGGCSKCRSKVGATQEDWNNVFIDKARKIHNDRYDYGNVHYVKARSKVTITCKVHGDFEQTPANHLGGGGCKHCAHEATGDRFRDNLSNVLQKFEQVHSGKYNYSLITEYNTCQEKLSVICPKHGAFQITAAHHADGSGCTSCADYGFTKGKPASLYILYSLSTRTTKVGITNREVSTRLQEVNRSSDKGFIIHQSHLFEDGNIPYNVETLTLDWLSSNYQRVDDIYDGSTECFIDVDMQQLTDFILSALPIQAAKTAYK